MEFTQELKEKIIKELNSRINKINKKFCCPACKNKTLNVIDGFSKRNLDNDTSIFNLDKAIPSISAVCSNCGYIMDFAIGSLGFLNVEDKKETKEEKNDAKN